MDELKKYNPQNYEMSSKQFSSFDDLYNSITKEGSLGLLALGAVGLKLWRKKRAELGTEKKGEKQNEQR